MIAHPSTPLVTTRETDEAAPLALPDLKLNVANDRKVQEWVAANLVPLIQQAIDDGEAIRSEWMDVRRMTLLQHNKKGYSGISKAFVPAYAKASSTRVSHQAKSLFPSDQYLDVSSERDNDTRYVEECKAWMQFQLERRAKLRVTIKPFLRQLNDYGVSVAKVWWEEPISRPMEGTLRQVGPDLLPDFRPSSHHSGVRFLARDVFSWYIWPTNAVDIDQATLVFESIPVDKQTFERLFETGRWLNRDRVGNRAGTDDESNMYRQLMNDDLLHNSNTMADTNAGPLSEGSIVQECWVRMPLPAPLLRAGEEPGQPVPAKVVLCNSVPVEVTRNPFWHQKPPYVFQTLEGRPDNFYGLGIGRMGLELQTLLNDFTNQTNDVARYTLNPIIKLNPSLMVGPVPSVGPGKVFNMMDPKGLEFDRPPVEMVQSGIMQQQTILALLNDMLGAPPVFQGSGGGGAAKTATGSQILQANAKTDIQGDTEETELQVLVPLMEMAYILGQQYEKDDVWIAITGAAPMRIPRETFLGAYRFRWMASTQTANQQLRAQQALMFLQSLPAMMPLLQMQGKVIDPIPVLRRIYADGIGGRDFDAIIKDMPTMPGAVPGAPAAPPGIDGAGGMPPEPRSAVEQAAGGSGGMVPGEGEEFMQIRQMAEDPALSGRVPGGPVTDEEGLL